MTAPDPLPAVDSLMAAPAKSRNMTLVTSNTRDFERTGIKLLNPFESH
jgi:predicted nucleic acid-binding protein